MDLSQVRGDLARVRTARHLVRVDRLHVVPRHALGDMRHRKIRHDAVSGEVDLLSERLHKALSRPHEVVLGEHHTLGWSCCPRGVDDGRQRLWRHERGRFCEVDSAVPVHEVDEGRDVRSDDIVRVVDDHQLFERWQLVANLEETFEVGGVFDDDDLGTAVSGEVGDLLG